MLVCIQFGKLTVTGSSSVSVISLIRTNAVLRHALHSTRSNVFFLSKGITPATNLKWINGKKRVGEQGDNYTIYKTGTKKMQKGTSSPCIVSLLIVKQWSKRNIILTRYVPSRGHRLRKAILLKWLQTSRFHLNPLLRPMESLDFNSKQ